MQIESLMSDRPAYNPVHLAMTEIILHQHHFHPFTPAFRKPKLFPTASLFFFKLYIIVLVLPNIKMNPPQVYMCSPSWTLFPPPSPYHPSGSSQCTSPKHPVSCIEPGLATRFIHDILHVSMPFSQIFPPSPSCTASLMESNLLWWVWSPHHQ